MMMALVKISEFENRTSALDDSDIMNSDVYSEITNEKIGNIKDILIDEDSENFRYFIVDIGAWIFGKDILLPIDYARISTDEKRVYAKDLTKEQAEKLPKFDESLRIDSDYEDQVSSIYPPRSLDTLNVNDPAGNPASPNAPASAGNASTSPPVVLPFAGDSPELVSDQEDVPRD
jgi:sporulation protein YlmC with PRC-barrel domain